MLSNEFILQFASAYTRDCQLNKVASEAALLPELAGLRMYDEPLAGVADAQDTIFTAFQQPHVIGPHHRMPELWLPGAQRVLSFFFPASQRVRTSNAQDMGWPSREWLHARIEGQAFLSAFIGDLRDALIAQGFPTIAPMLDPSFHSVDAYSSNWSERHAAYACGLGTFGLSRGLITERGVAGRFCSVLTTCPLDITPRPYDHYMAYCSLCGACARNCPADAINVNCGKDQALCEAFVSRTGVVEAPRYGCGKCQVRVPCEHCIPPHGRPFPEDACINPPQKGAANG